MELKKKKEVILTLSFLVIDSIHPFLSKLFIYDQSIKKINIKKKIKIKIFFSLSLFIFINFIFIYSGNK